jgi:hypothetical protein
MTGNKKKKKRKQRTNQGERRADGAAANDETAGEDENESKELEARATPPLRGDKRDSSPSWLDEPGMYHVISA